MMVGFEGIFGLAVLSAFLIPAYFIPGESWLVIDHSSIASLRELICVLLFIHTAFDYAKEDDCHDCFSVTHLFVHCLLSVSLIFLFVCSNRYVAGWSYVGNRLENAADAFVQMKNKVLTIRSSSFAFAPPSS